MNWQVLRLHILRNNHSLLDAFMRVEGPVLWRLYNVLRKKHTMQLIWALDSPRTRPCLKWYCAFVISKPHTRTLFLLCIYHGEGGSSFPRTGIRINSVSHLKDDKSAATDTKKQKKQTTDCVTLHSYGLVIVGELHMCFGSSHKSQAYINYIKKKNHLFYNALV